MARYTFQWITEQLAVGPAPLSYEDFDDIREAGINGIVNLGDEIAELSTIERQNGFEVYFLPIVDGGVPETPELEQAWSGLTRHSTSTRKYWCIAALVLAGPEPSLRPTLSGVDLD